MEVCRELTGNILGWWMDNMVDPRGGFYGRMDGEGKLYEDSPKGAILNSRILWTFASAYRIATAEKTRELFTDAQRQQYLDAATRARNYILDRFYDPSYGGLFWSVSANGEPLDTKKQFYAIGFGIYGLSEFYRATGDEAALECAKRLYRDIEAHSFDKEKNGYIEACTREWGAIEDMRLSEKDQNDAKTMNSHLHILEGYTCLYRVWKDRGLAEQLRNLINIFLDRIAGPDGHLILFFDEDWNQHGRMKSYGHDIEASWLIWEAAQVLGDEDIIRKAEPICRAVAEAGMEGFTPENGLIYESDPDTGHLDRDRHWWVQAEAVVGSWNQWQMTGEQRWKDMAESAWLFIRRHIICPEGEWYWSRRADGSANMADDRAGFWKCPYHNGRMCMELIERI